MSTVQPPTKYSSLPRFSDYFTSGQERFTVALIFQAECRHRCGLMFIILLSLFFPGCNKEDGHVEPGKPGPPPPGPNFSVVPIDISLLSEISAIGGNNKITPVSHTGWIRCNRLFEGDVPCDALDWDDPRMHLRAPADGTVLALDTRQDGFIRAEGPPGLQWHFGHVTPAPGLRVGSTFKAGDAIAKMISVIGGFDFGMVNFGIEHEYAAKHRIYHHGYLHGQHPIEQYPDSIAEKLKPMVRSFGESFNLGKLTWDVPGTAAGLWYILGAPPNGDVLLQNNEHMCLFLARVTERPETKLATVGTPWPETVRRYYFMDSTAVAWEDITVQSGPVNQKAWGEGMYYLPAYSTLHGGTFRVQLLHADTLKIEWFNTHDDVSGFTAASRIYTR